MHHYYLTAFLLIVAALPCTAAAQNGPDPARVEELTGLLPKSPRGIGPTIDDRAAWQRVAEAPQFGNVIENAEKLLEQPIPELTDDLFLDFSRTGNRTRCQRVLGLRHGRIPTLVLAECVENRGRFLPAIEDAVRAVCSENTWVMPAHDRGLKNFRGEIVEIDLAVAGFSWNLATADYWLGDRLSPEIKKLIRTELERRTFEPFERMVTTGKPRMWWLQTTNNWNAVCLAGVTGAAMAQIESSRRRAFFVAAAQKHVQSFLRGFTPDGYCSEGIGYWNYGFGHYTMLAETIHQATGGKVDMFDAPQVEQDALFGRRMEISPGIYPAFADCTVGTRPDVRLMAFLSRRYGLGMSDVEAAGLGLAAGSSSRLFSLGLFGFANSASGRAPAIELHTSGLGTLRDWFADAGVYIGRPAADDHNALAVALKGGHNAEHHNHNDVGSFVVTLGGKMPLTDPGAEVYTARTFSSRRYDSNVLNSLGHPLPRVAGKLQRSGRSAAAAIVKTEFTEAADTLVMHLQAAYGVKELKQLRRTFVFSRRDAGSLSVTDEVAFDGPQQFGTALITFSNWKQPAPNRLLVGDSPAAVLVEIDAGGREFRIEAVEIEEDVRGGKTPVRLGIDLTEPVERAVIALTITPAE